MSPELKRSKELKVMMCPASQAIELSVSCETEMWRTLTYLEAKQLQKELKKAIKVYEKQWCERKS